MEQPLSIDQHELAQLIQLLTLGQSSDNQQQAQVFHMLSSIEEKSISYIYLAYILAGEGFNVEIRKLAGVTLSSFLKRNKNVVHFSQLELHQLKQFLLSVKTTSLETVRSVAISELITRTNFDYELFYSLCSSQSNIGMVNIILEDIKYNSQNYNFLEHPQFRSIMASIYSSAIPTLQALVQSSATADPLFQSLLKCINLLTFHCPPALNNWLTSFVETVVKPVLIGLINHKEKAILLCLEGLNEIVATKSSLVSGQTLEIIINIDFIRLGANAELSKLWSNIMIEIVDNDDEGVYRSYLKIILPKVIEGLKFTHDDQRNMRQEMQVQYNPYGEQNSEAVEDDDNDPLQSSSGLAGYTLRKLSFQLINKISITYSQGLWEEWSEYIFQRIINQDPLISQTAVSFIGIIGQTCMYDMKTQLELLIAGLLGLARSGAIPILQATSFWTLQKLYPAIKQLQNNQAIIDNCLNLICSEIDMSQHNGNIQLMVKEAAISFLDQLLSGEQISPAVARNLTLIVHTLILGLKLFQGRALFNIFKTISSIFQNQNFNSILSEAVCDNLVGQICKKWSLSTKIDSVMCPLIECLITGFEGKRNYLLKFSLDFSKQLVPMLEKLQRKQLILRAIDFLSSLISSGQNNLAEIILSQRFLKILHGLILNQQKQIKHFAYILVSDLGKKYDITPYLEIFAQQIGRGMDGDSLTSRNNALMCLTDLIEIYPSARIYLVPVLGKIIEVISKEKLENVYAFNFSRMLGRIALIDPLQVKNWLLKEQKLLGFIFCSLRTREIDNMTTNSFKGMLTAVDLLTPQQILMVAADLQTVLQALVCYPLRRDQNQQNNSTLAIFIQFTKRLRIKIGEQQWRIIIQRPIFLQGAVRTLQSWCN